MAIVAEKVLELIAGNPVLIGYLAYIVGLLIAIAVVNATETRTGGQRRNSSTRYRWGCRGITHSEITTSIPEGQSR